MSLKNISKQNQILTNRLISRVKQLCSSKCQNWHKDENAKNLKMTKDEFIEIMKGLRYIKEGDEKDDPATEAIAGLINKAWDLLSNSSSSQPDECGSAETIRKDGTLTLHNLIVFLLAIENIHMP